MTQIDMKVEYAGKSRRIQVEAVSPEAKAFLANVRFIRATDKKHTYEVDSLRDYSQLLSYARRHAQTIEVLD